MRAAPVHPGAAFFLLPRREPAKVAEEDGLA
jgi:hypothetical protein